MYLVQGLAAEQALQCPTNRTTDCFGSDIAYRALHAALRRNANRCRHSCLVRSNFFRGQYPVTIQIGPNQCALPMRAQLRNLLLRLLISRCGSYANRILRSDKSVTFAGQPGDASFIAC